MRRWILGLAALASGCGGSLIDEPIRTQPSPTVEVAVAQKPSPPPGSLFRQDVNDAVEEGLGYFLQRVSVDPDLAGGKFQGFRIVELRPAEYWQGVDLKPGDVVTQVNGMPIERDIDAYQAFQALRVAPELRVTFTRGGAQRQLVYAIVDRDGKKPSTKPSRAG
jgi:S1-C subfamily serine protease